MKTTFLPLVLLASFVRPILGAENLGDRYIFQGVCFDLNDGRTSTAGTATGDFNRDGIMDIVAVDPGNNRVSIFLGQADGTFGSPPTYPVGQNPLHVEAGHLTNASWVEMATCN